MSARAKAIAIVLAGGSAFACSAILDFEQETPSCWCGEEWQGQVSGAVAFDTIGDFTPIPQTSTTYARCVSQAENVMLDQGDPALTNEFAMGAVAQCELAAVDLIGGELASTTCADQGATASHVGACWEPDPDLQCPLLGECRAKYDCDPTPVWEGYGDETGGVVEPGECVE